MSRKLLVICGHGAGDPGACGNGYQEAERVRALGARIKALGGDAVILADTSRNWYADAGIMSLGYGTGDVWIVELHMDSASASARGGHVIINGNYAADEWDERLAANIAAIFPGRSKTIVGRTDLANPNRAASRGYNYRLVENGFISNAQDVAVFNSRIDDVARAYLDAFGIAGGSAPEQGSGASPAPSGGKTVAQLADEVIAGQWGNGDARRAALEAAGYDYAAVQAEVNRRYGVGSGSGASDIDDLARRAIAGEFGNGEQRRAALGADYDAVQARVNEMLGYGGGSGGSIGVGSSVVVVNPVDENGTRLAVSGAYTVMEVSGSRVVIGRGGSVTAALPMGNLRLA